MQQPFDPFLLQSTTANTKMTGLRLCIVLTKANWFIFKSHQQCSSVLDELQCQMSDVII